MAELSGEIEHKKEVPQSPVITEQFIDKTKSFFELFQDDTRLIDFQILSKSREKLNKKNLYHNLLIQPPAEWIDFLSQIPVPQKAILMNCIGQLVSSGFEDFGQVREATAEEIAQRRASGKIIGLKRAGLIKQIIPPLKQEPGSNT